MIRRVRLSVVGVMFLLTACAPTAGPRAADAGSPERPAAPKVLVVGAQRALTGFGGQSGSPQDAGDLLSDGLVAKNYRGEWIPQLARSEEHTSESSHRL